MTRVWTCRSCRVTHSRLTQKCGCGQKRPAPEKYVGQLSLVGDTSTRVCARCGERQPIDNYYFVSKKLGTRRGQCKACMSELKAIQKDPDWRPSCSRCGVQMDRFGPGRRLCSKCFNHTYDAEAKRPKGAHRHRLNPCSACGFKRLRADHFPGSSLCPICRSVPQQRRKRLRVFNLSPRMFLEMLEYQGYRCYGCDRLFKGSRTPNVDHRHGASPIVRGLLCASCNTMIAIARDNPDTLRGAAKYLEAPPAQFMYPGLVAEPEADRKGGYAPLKRVWAK